MQATVDYMGRGPHPYELFQLHSPLFAQNRAWVEAFVARKAKICPAVPFKSVDLANPYAEERLVAELASMGLRGIGFGIETLSADSRRSLTPKVDEKLLEQISHHFQRYGVEGKAYTQLGLPGQRQEDVFYTHQLMLDLGFLVRATGDRPPWQTFCEGPPTVFRCLTRRYSSRPTCPPGANATPGGPRTTGRIA